MPSIVRVFTDFVAAVRQSLAIDSLRNRFGPLLIDRGHGLLYDVERDITWLQDSNYAKTIGRTPDGQMDWPAARAWVAGLTYRGIGGWRLPDARGADGSGPREAENSADGEIGHLFLVASKRMSPSDLQLKNFDPYRIYWYRNEASATEAWGYKMVGLKQGKLAKNPWQMGDVTIPLPDKVLAWPVHDGDVGANLFSRFVRAILELFAFSRRGA